MCVGNEKMTPPALMLYLKKNGYIKVSQDPQTGERPKNWLVRTIPNLYPAFTPPKQPQDAEKILQNKCLAEGIGHHEVIIESPNHDEDPADAETPQLELVIQAYIDRLREISAKPYVQYVSIFRNYGQQAGASLSHPHSQLIATPIVPVLIQEEVDAAKRFLDEKKKCIFCDIIEKETNGPRLISEDDDFVVFAPYASINPMEFWIMPKRHQASLLELKECEVSALAKTLRHIPDPLTQLKLYADGKKIHVEVEGRAMEAVSGQLLLDFDRAELKRLVEFRIKEPVHAERERRLEAERWFQRGLELEQTGAPPEQILEAYQEALKRDPNSAGALVNLGTIHFNSRNWTEAERCYLEALRVDPAYALAHFDLANLYDERGDRTKALEHYEAALRIAPNYADAHYNLALLCQSSNQAMKAVRHWTTYLKLDPSSNWSEIARKELAKIRQNTVLPGYRV